MAFEVPQDPGYWERSEKSFSRGREACAVCGRAVNIEKPHWRSYFHHGGFVAVTEEEYEKLNAEGHGSAQMGTWPVGPECRKRYAELDPYLIRNGGL